MRNKPYTQIGIERLKCFRCKNRAFHQWNICSDNGVYRPICKQCDIALNELVLRWMGFKDWKNKIKIYEKNNTTA